MKRELETAAITALYETVATDAVRTFNDNQGKDFLPQLLAFDAGEKPGHIDGLLALDSKLINMLQQGPNMKRLLMVLVRVLLSDSDEDRNDISKPLNISTPFAPNAVVHISETWVLRKTLDPTCENASLDEALDDYDSISEHPERAEALIVSIYTPHRSYHGLCPIAADGDLRRASFEPLCTNASATGRMQMNPADEHAKH